MTYEILPDFVGVECFVGVCCRAALAFSATDGTVIYVVLVVVIIIIIIIIIIITT